MSKQEDENDPIRKLSLEVDRLEREKEMRDKILEEENELRKRQLFNSKMSAYFQNPYQYTFVQLCSDLEMTETEALQKIKNDARLSSFYNNIIFAQKTTADELLELLINNIPPDFDTNAKYNEAMENPAFNVVYSYYFFESPTIDYYKLVHEKNMSNAEIQNLFKNYIGKSEAFLKKFKEDTEYKAQRLKEERWLHDF